MNSSSLIQALLLWRCLQWRNARLYSVLFDLASYYWKSLCKIPRVNSWRYESIVLTNRIAGKRMNIKKIKLLRHFFFFFFFFFYFVSLRYEWKKTMCTFECVGLRPPCNMHVSFVIHTSTERKNQHSILKLMCVTRNIFTEISVIIIYSHCYSVFENFKRLPLSLLVLSKL